LITKSRGLSILFRYKRNNVELPPLLKNNVFQKNYFKWCVTVCLLCFVIFWQIIMFLLRWFCCIKILSADFALWVFVFFVIPFIMQAMWRTNSTVFDIFYLTKSWNSMEKSLSHKMSCTPSPGIFDNIFRLHFFLEIDISMIFRGHKHIIITHCY
jgi:hypothetical protein